MLQKIVDLKNRWVVPVLSALVVLGFSATGAFAADPPALESLIDFDNLAPQVLDLMKTAVAAAASVGVVVMAATVCWRFFKRFIRG